LHFQWVTCKPTRTWQNQQPSRSKEAKLEQTIVFTTGDYELGSLATDDKKTGEDRRRDKPLHLSRHLTTLKYGRGLGGRHPIFAQATLWW
jgi:hypothetical protein